MQTFYPSLGNQARRVTELCRAIGQIAKLPPDEQRVLESAALLHDIGLVGVPRQIIRRWQEDPDSLAEPERALIQQHPILGQELASLRQPPRQGGLHHSRAITSASTATAIPTNWSAKTFRGSRACWPCRWRSLRAGSPMATPWNGSKPAPAPRLIPRR